MRRETTIQKMAREIYNFVEEKYAGKDLSTRDIRRGLREAIDKVELYELIYGIKETDSLVYFPFEKGYKKRIFSDQRRKRTTRVIEFPLNRYEILDEADKLFKMHYIDLDLVLQVLRDSVEGFLAFRFGDISVDLSRDSEQSENLMHVSIAVEKGGMRRDVSFEYETGNLGSLAKKD